MKMDTHKILKLLRMRFSAQRIARFCENAIWAVLEASAAALPELNPKWPEFELFGADLLPTSDLRPVLVEVNAYPSLAPSDARDEEMKKRVVQDLVGLAEKCERSRDRAFGPARFGSWLQVFRFERQPRPDSFEDAVGVLGAGAKN